MINNMSMWGFLKGDVFQILTVLPSTQEVSFISMKVFCWTISLAFPILLQQDRQYLFSLLVWFLYKWLMTSLVNII